MRTKIYISKKLEKSAKKLIIKNQEDNDGALGKWNATIFFVDRKKCWLITNGKTRYNVVLTDVKASDLKNIDSVFKDSLYSQLIYDGIILDVKNLDQLIGELDFRPTDNDRKVTGFQNHRLHDLEYWKYEFHTLANMPIKDLANRMNSSPIHIGERRRMSDYTDSITEIKKLLI